MNTKTWLLLLGGIVAVIVLLVILIPVFAKKEGFHRGAFDRKHMERLAERIANDDWHLFVMSNDVASNGQKAILGQELMDKMKNNIHDGMEEEAMDQIESAQITSFPTWYHAPSGRRYTGKKNFSELNAMILNEEEESVVRRLKSNFFPNIASSHPIYG